MRGLSSKPRKLFPDNLNQKALNKHLTRGWDEMRNFDLWKKERDLAEDMGVLKVYRYETVKGMACVALFKPKAKNPYRHESFSSEKAMERYIAEQIICYV